jgi:hypothetical protein
MTRNLLAAAALAAALLPGAAAPATADAAGMRMAKFHAQFEATYETTWSMPEHHVISDCFHQTFQSGRGTERWQLRSRGKAPVAVTSHRGTTFFHVGTWETTGDPVRQPLRAAGMHTRDGSYTDRTAPGECGGTPKVEVSPRGDCGTKLPRYEVAFSVDGRKVRPSLSDDPAMRNEVVRFDDCPINLAEGLTDGAWPDVEAKLPKRLFGTSRKPIEITGRKRWSGQQRTGRGYGVVTTASTMHWTLRLTRAR